MNEEIINDEARDERILDNTYLAFSFTSKNCYECGGLWHWSNDLNRLYKYFLKGFLEFYIYNNVLECESSDLTLVEVLNKCKKRSKNYQRLKELVLNLKDFVSYDEFKELINNVEKIIYDFGDEGWHFYLYDSPVHALSLVFSHDCDNLSDIDDLTFDYIYEHDYEI